MGHARALVDHEPFDLEELEAVARVDGLVAVAAPGREDADGWLDVAHGADLARRRVRAQQQSSAVGRCDPSPAAVRRVTHVDRVPQVARGMVVGDVEGLEVQLVGLDLRALDD